VVDRGVWVLVVAGPVAREHWAAPLTGPPARGPVCDRSCAILIVDLLWLLISDARHAWIVILDTIKPYSCNGSLECAETSRQEGSTSSSGSNGDLAVHRAHALSPDEFDTTGTRPVGGPVPVAWREGTLTRAKELESLCAWILANPPEDQPQQNCEALKNAIHRHLQAASEAAKVAEFDPKKPFRILRRSGPLIERAMSNLDAAEAQILNLAPPSYLYGQLPSLLRNVQCHLIPTDPSRQEFERIARKVGVKDPDHPAAQNKEPDIGEKKKIVEQERGKIVTTVRAASSAKLREQVRVRSFRNVLVLTIIFMILLAIGVALLGLNRWTLIPLCFAPQEAGETTVVCPTAQSEPFVPIGEQPPGEPPPDVPVRDIDVVVEETAKPQDLIVVELVGLTAAAIAAAAAIRRIKGSSERYGIPLALASLKLPTGAITAFLGLLLMRGQFVPGLSALDTSAQILAWALVFGYAQQLFTRLVDQQGQNVLEAVRGADKEQPTFTPP
jgi:hypothetical protein